MTNKIYNKKEDDEEIRISLEHGEKILMVRDFVERTEGRRMGFIETLNYILEEVAYREGILDELHKKRKKKNNV